MKVEQGKHKHTKVIRMGLVIVSFMEWDWLGCLPFQSALNKNNPELDYTQLLCRYASSARPTPSIWKQNPERGLKDLFNPVAAVTTNWLLGDVEASGIIATTLFGIEATHLELCEVRSRMVGLSKLREQGDMPAPNTTETIDIYLYISAACSPVLRPTPGASMHVNTQ